MTNSDFRFSDWLICDIQIKSLTIKYIKQYNSYSIIETIKNHNETQIKRKDVCGVLSEVALCDKYLCVREWRDISFPKYA